MNKLNNIQHFQLFCLESYRASKKITGIKAFNAIKQSDMFEYLSTGYDVLHTQGKSFLIADMQDYIQRRK